MSKTRNYITWALTVLLAIVFLGAGFAKVTGQEEMVASFVGFGLPDWFRIAIGTLEIIGGLLLLVPVFTGMSSFGLSIIMVGAIACHIMFDPIANAIPAFVFLGILIYLFLTRRNIIPVILQKYLVV